jgi:hypothetical protein
VDCGREGVEDWIDGFVCRQLVIGVSRKLGKDNSTLKRCQNKHQMMKVGTSTEAFFSFVFRFSSSSFFCRRLIR